MDCKNCKAEVEQHGDKIFCPGCSQWYQLTSDGAFEVCEAPEPRGPVPAEPVGPVPAEPAMPAEPSGPIPAEPEKQRVPLTEPGASTEALPQAEEEEDELTIGISFESE